MTGKITITIQDKQVGLYFGMPANRMFFSRLVEQYGEDAEVVINETDIAFLAWCGYQNQCLISDAPAALTKGNFIEWVDEMMLSEEDKKILESVSSCYSESRFTKQYIENVNNEVDKIKKKLNGTTSNHTVTEN
jgi:hypothetical protein